MTFQFFSIRYVSMRTESRPAEEQLSVYFNRYRDWLIPDILGNGTPEELAAKLVGKFGER